MILLLQGHKHQDSSKLY